MVDGLIMILGLLECGGVKLYVRFESQNSAAIFLRPESPGKDSREGLQGYVCTESFVGVTLYNAGNSMPLLC